MFVHVYLCAKKDININNCENERGLTKGKEYVTIIQDSFNLRIGSGFYASQTENYKGNDPGKIVCHVLPGRNGCGERTFCCKSAQPIFSYFSGMDDLKNALDQKAHDVFEQTVSEEAKDCPALEGSSNAYVRFATEQPRLFAHMFLREDGGMQSFGSELAREPMITAEASEKGLDSEKAKRVCEDVMLYAHGLAAMQATGRTNFTQPQIAQRVHEMHEMLLKK